MKTENTTSIFAGTQLGVCNSVVRLYSWPALSDFGPDLVPDVARVCALLAIRPTGVPLLPVLLGMSRERANFIVETLYGEGYLDADDASDDHEGATALAASQKSELQIESQNSSASSGFLGRLWQRLVGVKGG